MKRKFITTIIILVIFQLMSCVSVYRFVRDKRDRCYKEGVDLYSQNKFEDACDRFETVVDIEPEYKDAKRYLMKTQKILYIKKNNIKLNANKNYEKGVAMMKYGRYDDALTILLLAEEQDSNLIDVDEKIEECRTRLAPRFEKLLKTAEQQYDAKKYIPAYNTCLKAKTYNPSSNQLSTISGNIENKLEESSGKYVDKGRELYEKKQYAAAKKQLGYALYFNPWDNNAKELLDKVNGELNLVNYYQRGIALFNNGDYFNAGELFSQVNSIEPGYKDTNQYLNKINTWLGNHADVFYKSGVAFYDKGNYKAAINELNKVLSINPNHSTAREYRERAQGKLEMQKSLSGGESK